MQQTDPQEPIHQWLNSFSECVRNRNFNKGEFLFDDDVISYGTWTIEMLGLKNLVKNQWRNVWPQTKEFRFIKSSINLLFDNSSSPTQCTVACQWLSYGETKEQLERTGRCTIVLQKKHGHWLAIHSHFSSDPKSTL
jgi:ketosteroid isomerase-like protein